MYLQDKLLRLTAAERVLHCKFGFLHFSLEGKALRPGRREEGMAEFFSIRAQISKLNNFQDTKHTKKLLSPLKNLGNRGSLRVGFMSIYQTDFDWQKFEKKFSKKGSLAHFHHFRLR